jgi:hypothetical protein
MVCGMSENLYAFVAGGRWQCRGERFLTDDRLAPHTLGVGDGVFFLDVVSCFVSHARSECLKRRERPVAFGHILS